MRRQFRNTTSKKDDQLETNLVLAALADPVRRMLLNDLDTWVGVPMSYLREEHRMSRQGLHKHLEVLIKAGIVIKTFRGRAAIYYIDPRPIQRVAKELASAYERDLRPLGNLDRFGSPHSPFD